MRFEFKPVSFGTGFLFFGKWSRRVDLRLLAAASKKGAKQPAAPRRVCAPGFFVGRKEGEQDEKRGFESRTG